MTPLPVGRQLIAGMLLTRGMQLLTQNAASLLDIGNVDRYYWSPEDDWYYGWAEILFDLCGRKFPSEAQFVQWMNSQFNMLERELNALYIDEDYFQYLLEALQCAYHSGRNAYYLYVNKPPAPTMTQNDQIFERNKLQTIEEEMREEEMK